MGLSSPGQVVRLIGEGSALVAVRGTRQQVRLTLLTAAKEHVAAGDWLLVQVGLAVARLTPAEALWLVPALDRVRDRATRTRAA